MWIRPKEESFEGNWAIGKNDVASSDLVTQTKVKACSF